MSTRYRYLYLYLCLYAPCCRESFVASFPRRGSFSPCADGRSKANAPATPPTMGKDKKSNGGGFSSPASGGGLAAALGHAGSPASTTGPSLLSAVLGDTSLDPEAQCGAHRQIS